MTTHQVLRRCGIGSPKTLTRWGKIGLVPRAQVAVHPRGRGKVGVYPWWICYRIQQVKKFLGRGESLDRIAKILGDDWAKEEKKWSSKRPNFREQFARVARYQATDKFAQWGTDVVYDFLRRLGVQRPGISDQLARILSDRELVDEAVTLLLRGCTPVLILGEETLVVPDFLLHEVLDQNNLKGEPALIIPIRDALLASFSGPGLPELPKKPTYKPGNCVVERSETGTCERRFRRKGKWGFVWEESKT